MNKYTHDFTIFNRPAHRYVLAVYKDRELFGYSLSIYKPEGIEMLLMKDFSDESQFKKEVESINAIFTCSVYSDTYDLLSLNL